MPGLTLDSLRAISAQANRELANAQRKLEHAQQYHRSTMQKAGAMQRAYEEARDVAEARRAKAHFMDSDGPLEAA